MPISVVIEQYAFPKAIGASQRTPKNIGAVVDASTVAECKDT